MLTYVTEYINKAQEYICFPRRAEMAYSDTLKKKTLNYEWMKSSFKSSLILQLF